MRPLILGVLYVALVVYALVDAVQSDDEERHGVSKGLWVGVIILLPLVGSIAWIVLVHLARRRRGRAAAADWDRAGRGTPARPGEAPAGPDDDPEYMWRLEQDRLRRAREQRRADRDGREQRARDDDGPGDAPAP